MQFQMSPAKITVFALVLQGLLVSAETTLNRDVFKPIDAHHSIREPLPKNASLINRDEFEKNVNAGQIRMTNPNQIKTDQNLALKRISDNKRTVEDRLSRDPELLERLTRKPNLNDSSVKRLDDGNFSIVITDSQGKKQSVITMGDEHLYGELNASVKSADDQQNQWKAYALLYEGLPQKYIKETKLLSPSETKNFSAADLQNLNFKIAADIKIIEKYLVDIGAVPPAGRPAQCSQEIGAGSGWDETGGTCAHNPNGIYSKVAYPLRYYATCVKNQGNRGSCVAFGVTGSMETAAAVKHGKWFNFSEQDLYNKAKMTWYPTNYGDGLNTAGIMSNVVTFNYSFPYENKWLYNPSYSRIDDAVSHSYTHSCDGYSGTYCSDTAHQGHLTCTEVLGLRFCGYTAPLSGSGFKATNVASVWDPMRRDQSIALARAYLAAKIPLTIAIPVTPSFDNAPSTGFVNYVGPNELNRGSHALTVVGAVTNAQLTAGMPQGAGGGYFIIKNSWGACWKDGGYIYLPFSWIKDYTLSLTAMTGVL